MIENIFITEDALEEKVKSINAIESVSGDDYVSLDYVEGALSVDANVIPYDEVPSPILVAVTGATLHYTNPEDGQVTYVLLNREETGDTGNYLYWVLEDGGNFYSLGLPKVNEATTIYEMNEEIEPIQGSYVYFSDYRSVYEKPEGKGLVDAYEMKSVIGEPSEPTTLYINISDELGGKLKREPSKDMIVKGTQGYAWGIYQGDSDEIENDDAYLYSLSLDIKPNSVNVFYALEKVSNKWLVFPFMVNTIEETLATGIYAYISDKLATDTLKLKDAVEPKRIEVISNVWGVEGEEEVTVYRAKDFDADSYLAWSLDEEIGEDPSLVFTTVEPFENDEVKAYQKDEDAYVEIPNKLIVVSVNAIYDNGKTGIADTLDVKQAIGSKGEMTTIDWYISHGSNGYVLKGLYRTPDKDITQDGIEYFAICYAGMNEYGDIVYQYVYFKSLDFKVGKKYDAYIENNGKLYLDTYEDWTVDNIEFGKSSGIYEYVDTKTQCYSDDFVIINSDENGITSKTCVAFIDNENIPVGMETVFCKVLTSDATDYAYYDLYRKVGLDSGRYYAWFPRIQELNEEATEAFYTLLLPSKSTLGTTVDLYKKDENGDFEKCGTAKFIVINSTTVFGSYINKSAYPLPSSYGKVGKLTLDFMFSLYSKDANDDGYYTWNGYLFSGETKMWYSTEFPTTVDQEIYMYTLSGSSYVKSECKYKVGNIFTHEEYTGEAALAVAYDVKKHFNNVTERIDSLSAVGDEYVGASVSDDVFTITPSVMPYEDVEFAKLLDAESATMNFTDPDDGKDKSVLVLRESESDLSGYTSWNLEGGGNIYTLGLPKANEVVSIYQYDGEEITEIENVSAHFTDIKCVYESVETKTLLDGVSTKAAIGHEFIPKTLYVTNNDELKLSFVRKEELDTIVEGTNGYAWQIFTNNGEDTNEEAIVYSHTLRFKNGVQYPFYALEKVSGHYLSFTFVVDNAEGSYSTGVYAYADKLAAETDSKIASLLKIISQLESEINQLTAKIDELTA